MNFILSHITSSAHFTTIIIDFLFALLLIILLKNIIARRSISLKPVFVLTFFFLCSLLVFYLINSLEISNVWSNSHKNTPLLYKIAGLWGNHEGSMLLFYTLLCTWATFLLRSPDAIRLASFVLLALGLYIYFNANPFTILAIKATTGQDLNPALQNPYLAIHPPILYAGQTLCFALWVKACVEPQQNNLRTFSIVCFLLITLGLALGSRWAYGELGWGGFWFWDPVETVSLFPWLTMAAAIHAKKEDTSRYRNCLLLSFPMVMIGLTLVRSGVLVSVHSFGFDLNNGLWLSICAISVSLISALVFYKQKTYKDSYSLRSMIPFGFLWFLTMLVALILLPILIKILFKADIAIDEHFFHQYINPLLLIGLIFCGFSPFMKLNKSHFWCLLSTVLLTSMWCFMAQPYFSGFATFAAFVGFWILCSVINSINKIFIKGFVAAHLGVGLCILGASHSEIFTTSQEYDLAHLPKIFASYPISYKSMHKNETPQMTEEIVQLQVNSTLLMPSLQHFHTNLTTKHKSTWVGIYLDHIHATCFTQNNTWRVELMHKPWINIFWLGVVFILLGISVSAGNAIFKQRYQQIL